MDKNNHCTLFLSYKFPEITILTKQSNRKYAYATQYRIMHIFLVNRRNPIVVLHKTLKNLDIVSLK